MRGEVRPRRDQQPRAWDLVDRLLYVRRRISPERAEFPARRSLCGACRTLRASVYLRPVAAAHAMRDDPAPHAKLEHGQITPPEPRRMFAAQFGRKEAVDVDVGGWQLAEGVDVDQQQRGS